MSALNFELAEATSVLSPLAGFVVAVALYSMFIFRFYRYLASKDIFELDFSQYEQSRIRSVRMLLHFIFYVAKYLVLFPFLAFFWFAVLTLLLVFLAKEQPIESILLVSMAVVSAIRITAYYNEDLSRDLAKILPFALLGIILIDLSYFSLPRSLEALSRLGYNWPVIVYYLSFVVVLELALRIGSPLLKVVLPSEK